MSDATVFAGIGICAFLCVFAWIMYQLFRPWKGMADTEELYDAAHHTMLRRFLKKKDIDVDKELAKTRLLSKVQGKKNIRRRLESEVYDDFFGKEKE